jgi:N-acetylglutamate synthase-like GNAT family acetyltransferase
VQGALKIVRRSGYRVVSGSRSLLGHLNTIHTYLTSSYWAEGIPKKIVRKSMQGSICFGVLHGKELVAFSRVITDKATYAYLADVFVLEAHRGEGLSKRMMEAVKAHKDLQGIRRFMLVTRDAHGLYKQYGFVPLSNPDRHMELLNRDVYKKHRK